MPDTLRPLNAADIPAAMQLSTEAGWNQTAEDWRMLLDLAPDGCFAIEADGTLAATTALVCYGKRLAWIGMVLTTSQYRGRGFARRLLTNALEAADRRQIESVKLDATDQGQPLYETMGFRFEQIVERWTRAGSGAMPALNPKSEWHDDSEAFGADRSGLLRALALRNPPLTFSGSYLFTRPGRQTAYLGPSVCGDPATATRLLESALQASSAAWSWDILAENTNAVALARASGFTPRRRLARMVRGKDLRGKEDALYAIAGFELG